MSLKHRIEALQTVIRQDKRVVLKVIDDQQRKEPFKAFFDQFEEIRNASVHYSPIKHRIWMAPDEWIALAREFSEITLQVAMQIWKACYPTSDGPLYLGKLDKAKQVQLAAQRLSAFTDLHNLISAGDKR